MIRHINGKVQVEAVACKGKMEKKNAKYEWEVPRGRHNLENLGVDGILN
jgi:hypothetical protein